MLKSSLRDRGQHSEAAGGVEHAVSHQGVDMRIERDQIAEGLDVKDKAGPACRSHGVEALIEQLGDDLAKPGQQFPALPEIGSQEFRKRKHVLAMGNRGEDVLLDPLPVREHAFLVTTGAEVTGLAGKCEQVIVAAVVAIHAYETLMQITAVEKAGEDLSFHGAGEVSAGVELMVVAGDTLI